MKEFIAIFFGMLFFFGAMYLVVYPAQMTQNKKTTVNNPYNYIRIK